MTSFLSRAGTACLLPLLTAAATPAQAPAAPPAGTEAELHRATTYPGAAAFPELGEMTIVYPAAKGEPVEVNRRSAEARARYLTAAFRANVTVVADDQITEAQKTGNVLILGWTNRAWQVLGASRPFARDAGGVEFLGIREDDPAVDLLVFHRNPANWTSFILFWSRIDPTRDRFMVLPRVGSDWAMLEDYRVVRQGMFKPARSWPPARDAAAEGEHAEATVASTGAVGEASSEHYRLRFDTSVVTGEEPRAILDAREAALARAAGALGPLPAGFKISLFVYDDAARKKAATGIDDAAHSLPARRELHMIRRVARSSSPHEETHLLAEALFGPCVSNAIYEGLALAVENSWRGEALDFQAARLRTTGKLPSVADLLDEESLRTLPEGRGMAGAGILLTSIRTTYKPDGWRRIYALPEVTPATVAKALGTTAPALEAGFAAWADGQVVARKADLDFAAAEAEAQKRQAAGDWPGLAGVLRKALVAKPGDPQTLFNLASAEMRAGDLPGAEAHLKALLALPLLEGQSRFRVFGHYQLGRVYDLAGRRESAVEQYNRVLALAEDHGSHALARERLASPATREHLE